MGQQDSVLKFKGRIGEVAMFKGKNGYQARKQAGMEGRRVKEDSRFERTRENASEFGRAGLASRLLRTAIRPLLLLASDGRVTSRLTQAMIKVLQADPISVRGQRNVTNGAPELLKGFEFNINAKFVMTFTPRYSASIDRETGNWQIDIPAFISAHSVLSPEGTTHFRLIGAGAEVDFEAKTDNVSIAQSETIPLSREVQAAISITDLLPANSTNHLFLLLGIEFVQLVNGIEYPLKSGAHNAMTIVEVDRGNQS